MNNFNKNSGFKYDVFLSCAGEDKIYVKEFYNKLRQYGAKIFYYDILEDGAYGTDPNNFLFDVLKNSQHLVFYWTKNSNKEWTNKEIEYFEKNCKNGKNRDIIVYHDIMGKTDYTELPTTLKNKYYREVDFAELLKRIGADSASYMEKRYFRLSEFVKKPAKQIDVEMKVGIGCCIWAAPVIRKIMDDGGIANAQITFFEKYQFKKTKATDVNGLVTQNEKYECEKAPYFYSRKDKSSKLLTIPDYLKNGNKKHSAWSEKIELWNPFFTSRDNMDEGVFSDIIAEKYQKFALYQVQDSTNSAITVKKEGIAHTNTTLKDVFIFMENAAEGLFVKTKPQVYFNYLLKMFLADIQVDEEFYNALKRKLHTAHIKVAENETKNSFVKDQFSLENPYLDEMLNLLDSETRKKVIQQIKKYNYNFQEFLTKKIKTLDSKIKNVNGKTTLNQIKESFPLLYKILEEKNSNNRQIDISMAMYEWRKILIVLYDIIKIASMSYLYNDENDFSKDDTYKMLDDEISFFANDNKTVSLKIYEDEKQKLLLILDKKFVRTNNGYALLGYADKPCLSKIKDKFDNRIDFVFCNGSKLYTAKDIVGLVHDEKLDCVIIPSEVYDQEHEKGKNSKVLTKIARIMYTVAGGCDFLFISNDNEKSEKFKALIKAEKEEQLKCESDPDNIKLPKSNERRIIKLFEDFKKNDKYDKQIKILYTPNTVSKKYHEKYFNSKDLVHEAVDIGDWNSIKEKIKNVFKNDEVVLVLGWQPQISWIKEYFKEPEYFICDENLMLLEGAEDLPYLSYDIMLRTNVFDTWFRSYPFESFLNTIKESIDELNKCMQSPVDTVDTPVEVDKIATFLNMDEEICKKYLKKINFEFRYDPGYTSLYERYIKKMNNEC